MRAIVALDDPTRREEFRRQVLAAGLECVAEDAVSYASLPVRLSQAGANLVLVVLGSDPSAGLAVVRQALTQTTAPVLAVGPVADASIIRQAIREGAREYLDENRFREELLAALEKFRILGTIDLRRGTTIAVTGARPGSGVTTVATSLAFALAHRHPRQVILAEMGQGVPELALDLDLEPAHSVADLVPHRDRLDTTLLRRALVEHPAGVHVLAYKPETLTAVEFDPDLMTQVLVLLRTMADRTVLDLGHSLDPARLQALKLAETVLLVVPLDVPSLRLNRRFLQKLQELGLPREKVRLVANRYGQRRQFDWRKAQETLGLPFLEWIPDDVARVNHALNQGQPLVCSARWASITRHFDKLASSLNGSPASTS
ncbi:MAG: hypothetical protein NZ700_04650 [Gemmataceae bacterium]|nr:hypothetical protein [Gemmataceae bacterium]MDW8264907.1 hypothetical protein [Gemmataceae bacterium]